MVECDHCGSLAELSLDDSTYFFEMGVILTHDRHPVVIAEDYER